MLRMLLSLRNMPCPTETSRRHLGLGVKRQTAHILLYLRSFPRKKLRGFRKKAHGKYRLRIRELLSESQPDWRSREPLKI